MYLLEAVPFLTLGTNFLTWLIASATAVLDFLIANEVTSYFLVAGLIWIVVRIVKSFVRI